VWPERPSLRFLIHKALRRDELCIGPKICPDAPDDGSSGGSDGGSRCSECWLTKLDEASGPAAQLLRRALRRRAALKMGFTMRLDEVPADEFEALLIIDEEESKREQEQANAQQTNK
jgi:hypothetical protein